MTNHADGLKLNKNIKRLSLCHTGAEKSFTLLRNMHCGCPKCRVLWVTLVFRMLKTLKNTDQETRLTSFGAVIVRYVVLTRGNLHLYKM